MQHLRPRPRLRPSVCRLPLGAGGPACGGLPDPSHWRVAAPTPLQLLVLLAANWGWCCGRMVGHCWPRGVQCTRVAGAAVAVAGLMGARGGPWRLPKTAAVCSPTRSGRPVGLPAWLLLSNWAMLPWLLPTFALPASVDASLAADPLAGAGDWAWRDGCWMAWRCWRCCCLWLCCCPTARFIQSRWRTAVFCPVFAGGMAAQFYLGVEPSWQPVVTAPAAGADPGPGEPSRWRAFVPVGV